MALEHNQETRDFISQFTEPTDSLRDDIIRGGLSKNQKILAIIAGLLGIGLAALAYYLYVNKEEQVPDPPYKNVNKIENWDFAWQTLLQEISDKKFVKDLEELKNKFIKEVGKKHGYKFDTYKNMSSLKYNMIEYFYIYAKICGNFDKEKLEILKHFLVSNKHKNKIDSADNELNNIGICLEKHGGAYQFYYYFLIVIIIILVILVIFLILKMPIVLSSGYI